LTILAQSFRISSPHKLGAQASLCTKTCHRSFCETLKCMWALGIYVIKNNETGAQTSFSVKLMQNPILSWVIFVQRCQTLYYKFCPQLKVIKGLWCLITCTFWINLKHTF
jgi:hypothetical protein